MLGLTGAVWVLGVCCLGGVRSRGRERCREGLGAAFGFVGPEESVWGHGWGRSWERNVGNGSWVGLEWGEGRGVSGWDDGGVGGEGGWRRWMQTGRLTGEGGAGSTAGRG